MSVRPPRAPADLSREVRDLLDWFAARRRPLPWREKPLDPYRVWVSEIMLQQTRIDTVIGYYTRFLAAFPTVRDLAAAPLQDVLRLWQGLGYYSRARNLHAAARAVVARHGGVFPSASEDLAALPGIGPYTAAAVASLCFREPAPVVDGNVLRVVSRRLALPLEIQSAGAKKAVLDFLRPRIGTTSAPGDFNEALMELGETVCLPSAPACGDCPWSGPCAARASGTPERWPVKAPPKTVPTRYEAALLLTAGGGVLLRKRTGEKFLGELWELPSVPLSAPSQSPVRAVGKLLRGLPAAVPEKPDAVLLGTVRHVYSHFKLSLAVVRAELPGPRPDVPPPYGWAPLADLSGFPLSKAPLLAIRLLDSAPSSR